MAELVTTQQFIAALESLERDRDLEQIAQLFAPDSEAGESRLASAPVGHRRCARVLDGLPRFLGEVASSFRNVIESDGRAALEWTTTGTAANGTRSGDDGVSILKITDNQITRFSAYFDPSDLGRHVERGTDEGSSDAS